MRRLQQMDARYGLWHLKHTRGSSRSLWDVYAGCMTTGILKGPLKVYKRCLTFDTCKNQWKPSEISKKQTLWVLTHGELELMRCRKAINDLWRGGGLWEVLDVWHIETCMKGQWKSVKWAWCVPKTSLWQIYAITLKVSLCLWQVYEQSMLFDPMNIFREVCERYVRKVWRLYECLWKIHEVSTRCLWEVYERSMRA